MLQTPTEPQPSVFCQESHELTDTELSRFKPQEQDNVELIWQNVKRVFSVCLNNTEPTLLQEPRETHFKSDT